MKFNSGPTVVPKASKPQPLSTKRDMTDIAGSGDPQAEARTKAISAATGGRVPNKDNNVDMASLMGNTASVKPSAPLKAEVAARVASGLGEEWVRQPLPSKGVPYDTKEVFLKPLSTIALSKISAAVKNNSYSMLVDALDACCSVDIRTLTPEDFNFVMMWVRLNSYPATPIRIPWTSRYGNDNIHTIPRTQLDIIELAMTREEFDNEWKSMGLCFPTVRDMEIQAVEKIADEDKHRVELSQYVASTVPFNAETYIQDKLDAYEALGVAIQGPIHEFIAKIAHGVREKAEVTDPKFTPEGAITHWRNLAEEISKVVASALTNSTAEEGNEIALLALSERIIKLRADADAMEKRVNDGEHVRAEKEVITVAMSVMEFFPYS